MTNWKNSDNLMDSTKEVFQLCEDLYGDAQWPVIVIDEYGDRVIGEKYILDLEQWRHNLKCDYSFDYVADIVDVALLGAGFTTTSQKYSFSDTYGYNLGADQPWFTNDIGENRNIIKLEVEVF